MLYVVMLSGIMLNVVMLSVGDLNIFSKEHFCFQTQQWTNVMFIGCKGSLFQYLLLLFSSMDYFLSMAQIL
jgi:hypothetical protein